jgi:hypothetical protein
MKDDAGRCPITYDEVQRLADAFERSADWLERGSLQGSSKTHPLVGLADYRKAARLIRAAAFLWASSNTEG